MIQTILRVFTAVNAAFGIALVAAAVWPPADPTVEKKPILVIIYLLWALFFLGLTRELFYVKAIARKWTIFLYGMVCLGIVWSLVSDLMSADKIIVVFPGVAYSVYLLFLAFFVSPVIFMFREDVKEFFIQFEEDRIKTEEDSARASLKDRR